MEKTLAILLFSIVLIQNCLFSEQIDNKASKPTFVFHFNEGSGATIYDATGTTGTETPGPLAWETGKYGNAIRMGGSVARIAVGDMDAFSPAFGAGTYIFTIKVTADGGIVTKGLGTNPTEFRFETTSNNLRLQFLPQDACCSVVLITLSSKNYNDNKFHRVGFSYEKVVSGSPVEVYVDGTKGGEAAADVSGGAMANTSASLFLGVAFSATMIGQMDDAVFYARRFTDGEWKSDYKKWLGRSSGEEGN